MELSIWWLRQLTVEGLMKSKLKFCIQCHWTPDESADGSLRPGRSETKAARIIRVVFRARLVKFQHAIKSKCLQTGLSLYLLLLLLACADEQLPCYVVWEKEKKNQEIS